MGKANINIDGIQATTTNKTKSSLQYFKNRHTLSPLYCFINLSSADEYEVYAESLKENESFELSDIYSYPQNSESIQIYDEVPYEFINLRIPIIYFVDYFSSLANNQVWQKMRNIENDIVLDSHGNVISLVDIIVGSQEDESRR